MQLRQYIFMIETFFFATAIAFRTWLVQREKTQLIRSMKESELRTLRSQINPHFIFNVISNIQSFILTEDKKVAHTYLNHFAKLMFCVCDND